MTLQRLRELGRDVRPCDCDYEQCQGWQMVNVEDYNEEERMKYETNAGAD